MEPLALWGNNKYQKPEGVIKQTNIKDYVVYHVPRGAFRAAATTFGDIRHADTDACYEEVSMQLFMQMLYETANPSEEHMPKDDIFPFVKAWLEWIPYENGDDDDEFEAEPGEIPRAIGYNIHAVSLAKDHKFGIALNRILHQNKGMYCDSINRKMNSRKADPISGLFPYQKWIRITGIEMFTRTICDRYYGKQAFTSQLDDIINPKIPLYKNENPANPSKVFSLETAIARAYKLDVENDVDIIHEKMDAYGDMFSDTSDGVLQFTSSEHVIVLTPDQLHPKVFCSKYLPEHQQWMDIQKTIPQKKLEQDFDPNAYTEYDIRTAAEVEKARIEGLADRSAFENLAMQSKHRYVRDCIKHEHNQDVFGGIYKKFQEWGVVAMERQCLDPDAKISEVVSKMLAWRIKTPSAAIVRSVIVDPTLSVFANRYIRLMEIYEQYYLVSTSHRMLYLVQHARYDAFRRDFGLHFNCFQAGDGACSKSFLFDLMAKFSIPGTIEVLTYQTGKADAVDGNRNDIVTVCHEAPPGMFRTAKNPNADSTQEAMFKEKLTSQRVTAKIWCQDEATGKRSSRVSKSECVGVWMGATNDPPSEVEEALKTRFFWGNFEQQRRTGRDIDDCMNGERMMSTEDKLQKKLYFREAQEEQYRVMLVEKAIWAKVIKDVNTTATNILVPRLKNKLNKNSIMRPNPRDWERVKIFTRNQAIVTAIETVCNLPGGKHYGEPFDAHMIPDLEPYLVVTEEMVIFSVSLLADQFRSPVEHKILNTIGAMERSNPSFGKPGTDVHCVDYIKLPKLKQLSKKINSRIPLEKGRTSINNIENFLLNMTKHSITSKPFKLRPVLAGSQAEQNLYPQEDTQKKARTYQSCHITSEGVYVHMQHIVSHLEDSSDSIFQILKSETHVKSDEKRIITACPVNPKMFHVMRVIERKKGKEKLTYHNVLANTKLSRFITQTPSGAIATRTMDGYAIEQDIDAFVLDKWKHRIGKNVYSATETIEYILDREGNVNRPVFEYPEDLIPQKFKSKKRPSDNLDEIEDNCQNVQKKARFA